MDGSARVAAAAEGAPWHSEEIAYSDERIDGAFEVFAFQTTPGVTAVMFQDITARKLQELQIAEAQARLRATLSAIPDLLFEVDMDGRYLDYHSPRADLLAAPPEVFLGKTIADNLLPVASYGHGREYWRAFGLILAWPLFIWNVFSGQPMIWWLVISLVQTFVVIPWIVRRWGKGAYCGWICSCGALAETMGDAHRHKMPHGPRWSRVNAVGQVILAVALLLLVFGQSGRLNY